MTPRWEIKETKTWVSNGREAGYRIYVVLDGGELVHTALLRSDAEVWLADYKADCARDCDHPEMTATIEGPDMQVTAECVICGMVGECTLDVDDLTWIGQR